MEKTRWIPVGRVVGAHGVRGDMRVVPYGESLGGRRGGDVVAVGESGGQSRLVTIREVRQGKQYLIISTEEIAQRETAEQLRGKEVFLPEDLLAPRGEGEFFAYQLIGLAVRTRDGDRVGVLEAIFSTAAHDLYVVRNGKREVLIPAVEDIVLEVNLRDGYVIVDPPNGLMGDGD